MKLAVFTLALLAFCPQPGQAEVCVRGETAQTVYRGQTADGHQRMSFCKMMFGIQDALHVNEGLRTNGLLLGMSTAGKPMVTIVWQFDGPRSSLGGADGWDAVATETFSAEFTGIVRPMVCQSNDYSAFIDAGGVVAIEIQTSEAAVPPSKLSMGLLSPLASLTITSCEAP